ncbi:hypothetical protein [Erwinia phage FBB1]|nr:hypothetical protein [Erwinia phage FBB1]
MSKAINLNDVNDIKKGMTLYHVYGVAAQAELYDINYVTRFQVVRPPYDDPIGSTPTMWIDGIANCLQDHNHKDNEYERKSLGDCGILDLNQRKIYNLNRLFWTYADALEFIEELNSKEFSDPADQAFYDDVARFNSYLD